jgi:subtilisin family serine protease
LSQQYSRLVQLDDLLSSIALDMNYPLFSNSLLQPDVTAPGVDVIAAYTEALGPSELPFDKRRTPYITMSGTSMSCPHVSGIVGLLRAIHPDWSPAALKSAIMTTGSCF